MDKMPSSSPKIVSRMKLNDNKAGMEGLDRDRINKIIYEASKGSSYYKNELKKEEQVNRRIAEQREQLNKLTEQQILQGELEADKVLALLEAGRDLSRTMVHIDMDAFYAAVEMRDNPSLKNKPMAVGGNSMLSTSNYLARRYGVRAAMPGFIGRKLCPNLVIVPTNFDKYTAVSKQIRAVMAEYDPHFVPMSLDEAYLDITEHLQKRKDLPESERTFKVQRKSSDVCECEGRAGKKLTSEAANCGTDMIQVTKTTHTGDEYKQTASETPVGNDRNLGILTDGERVKACLKVSSSVPVQFSAETPVGVRTEWPLCDDGQDGNTETCQEKPVIKCTNISKKSKDAEIAGDTNYDQGISERCCVCGRLVGDREVRIFGFDAEETVDEIRARIEVETQLTASAGIAANTMLSKVCSDMNKPNGQYKIPSSRQHIMDFVNELPIRKVSGIGKVSEKLLNALGVVKCSDLFHQRAILYQLYSRVAFMSFMEICLGLGSTHLESDGERKSMSVERTFSEMSQPQEMYSKCQDLCDSLAEDLAEHKIKGKTITLKLKTVDFKQMTRSKTIGSFTSDSEAIYRAASELLKIEIKSHNPLRLRLMGVRMSSFLNQQDSKSVKGTIKGFFKTAETTNSSNQSNIEIHLDEHVSANLETSSVNTASGSNTSSSSKPVPKGFFKSHDIKSQSEKSLAKSANIKTRIDTVSDNGQRRASAGTSVILGEKEEFVETRNQMDSMEPNCDNHLQDQVGFNDNEGLTSEINHGGASSSSVILVCPVCNHQQDGATLEQLNAHIDQCLNKSAIKEILDIERNSERNNPAPSSSNKRTITPSSAGQPARKKKKMGTGMTRIDSFFKQGQS